MHATLWDQAEAQMRIESVVRCNFKLFRHFPDIGQEDLVQDLLIELRDVFHTFKPGAGKRSFGGWVSMVAHRRLLNRSRNRCRAGRNEAIAASGKRYEFTANASDRGSDFTGRRVPVVAPAEVGDSAAFLPTKEEQDDEERKKWSDMPLADWLASVHAHACRAFNKPSDRRGRRGFTAAQEAAVSMLMQRMNLSIRGAIMVFSDRADLRRAVGFDRVPTYRWFWNARDVASLSNSTN